MRLYELTYEREDVEKIIDYNQIRKIRHLLGTDDKIFQFPKFKFNTEIPKHTLAFCRWSMGRNSVEIHLRPEILKYRDKTLINRLIAHELCHEATYFLYWIPLFVKDYEEAEEQNIETFTSLSKDWIKELDEAGDGHGLEWQKYANMVNGLIGPKYVTKTSDETYDFSLAKKWWQFWKRV